MTGIESDARLRSSAVTRNRSHTNNKNTTIPTPHEMSRNTSSSSSSRVESFHNRTTMRGFYRWFQYMYKKDMKNKFRIQKRIFLVMMFFGLLFLIIKICILFSNRKFRCRIWTCQPLYGTWNYEKQYYYEYPFPKTCELEYRFAPLMINTTHTYDISLYYHVGMIGNWIHVMHDQLDTLEVCGLGYLANTLTLSVDSNAPKTAFETLKSILQQYPFTQHLDNLSFIRSTDSETYEWPILQQIRTDCFSHPEISSSQHIIYYLHTKGVSKYSTEWAPTPEDTYYVTLLWRKYMEYFLFEHPTLCLRAFLFHNAKTCGVQVTNHPSLHYSGNFWSSTCTWIRQLNNTKLSETKFLTYVAGEMWIGNHTFHNQTNPGDFINLFTYPYYSLYLHPIYPKEYLNIWTNRSLWSTETTPIYLDYIQSLSS